MGYYIDFELGIDWEDAKQNGTLPTDPDWYEEVLAVLDRIVGENSTYHWLGVWRKGPEGFFARSEEQMKWYNYEDHMRQLSEWFPEVTFVLHGEGEESGDIWRGFARAGKWHKFKPTITWPEYKDVKDQLV